MSAENGGFFASRTFKVIMKYVYGIGGAIVIVGALFKILHLPGANIMLIVGLLTEAGIFTISAFEPLHEEKTWDWALVYPQLEIGTDGDFEETNFANNNLSQSAGGGNSLTQQLDEMLDEAKIGPELIESLGMGLRSLGEQTAKLNDVTDVSKVSKEFTENLKGAATNVNNLSESYAKASESLLQISVNPEDGAGYGEQLRKVTSNLTELNSLYEMQLKDTSDNLKAAGTMSEGISTIMKNLEDSVSATQRYKENISELGDNLSSLNTVYGNMLNAMNFNKGA